MARSHMPFSREKAIAIIASVLFIVFAVIGYTQYAKNALVSTFIEKGAPPPVDENDISAHQDDFIFKQNYLKDIKREVKEMQRESKNAINTATINELISKFSSCLTTLQSMMGSPDYWDSSQECDDIKSNIQTDLDNNVLPARECHKHKRGIEERKKEKKNNINSQMKSILKNDKDADISELTAMVAQMDEQFAKAAAVTSCTSDDNDVLKDVSNELDYIFRDFYNAADEIGASAEVIQELEKNKKDFANNFKKKCSKQLKRELNDYEKEIGELQKKVSLTADQQAAYDDVKSIYADLCTTIIADMEQALAERDTETFQSLSKNFSSKETDLRNETNELRRASNETQQSVQEQEQKEESLKNVTRDLQQKKRDLTRMQKELKRTNKLFNRAAKKYLDKAERKEALAAFAGYVAQAGDLVSKIETVLAASEKETKYDPDAYWDDRSDELDDLQNEFNDLQSNIGNIADSLQKMKKVERGLKSAQKDLANIRRESQDDPELMKSLEDLLSQTQELLQQAWSLLVTDPEEAMDAIREIQQLENDWNTTLQDWRENTYEE